MHNCMEEAEPAWDLYRTFLAVLDAGSLSGASRDLGLTQPTAGRHVAELERLLGSRLFTRLPGGLAPTPAALRIRPYAETLAATTQAVRRVAAAGDLQGGVSGRVRIACNEMLGVNLLPAILRDLRSRHPGVTVDLLLSDDVGNTLDRGTDIAVRATRPRRAALLCRPAGTMRVGLYGHRAYLRDHPAPVDTAGLASHALIGFDRETLYVRAMLGMAGLRLTRDMLSFRTDSSVAQVAAIRAGLGIGLCPVAFARSYADLVRVLPGRIDLALPNWVAMHEELGDVPHVRATFDALVGGLTREGRPATDKA